MSEVKEIIKVTKELYFGNFKAAMCKDLLIEKGI